MKNTMTTFLTLALLMFCSGVKAQEGSVTQHLGQQFEQACKTAVSTQVEKRNLFSVMVNRSGHIMVDGKIVGMADFEKALTDFIRASEASKSPAKKKSTVPLLGSVEVSQGVVSIVYDTKEFPDNVKTAVIRVFEKVRDEKAMKHFKTGYAKLNAKQRSAIDQVVPMKLKVEKYVEKSSTGTSSSPEMSVRKTSNRSDWSIDVSDDDNSTEVVAIEVEEVDEDDVVFVVVEQDPEFPGGQEAMRKFITDNMQYPPMARDYNIEGKVYVTFVVEKDGSLTGVKVLKDMMGLGSADEAVRIIKSMPKWNPGKQRGKPVRVQYNLPIVFSMK